MPEKCVVRIPWWKRPFDVVFSVIAIIITFPIIFLIALILKITDARSNIFYKQARVGYRGNKFQVIKFRTMIPDADKKLKEILKNNPKIREEFEKKYKIKDDPRVTSIGKFLRRTSLDELPQFINVLKGEMSVVGPRPVVEEELRKYYGKYSEIYKSIKPGITGYWQVEGRSDIEDYSERVKMDIWYARNISFWLDLMIIVKTLWIMVKGKGAY